MDFPVINFPNDSINYIAPTWDEMSELSFSIAKQMKEQGITADRIVTLAKGGWPMTRSLIDFTGIGEVASIGVKFYKKEIGERFDEPVVYQDLPVSVKGETVVLFDDVADTGRSLEFAKQYLLDAGVKKIATTTLFYKEQSIVKPDFYGSKTSSWIVFPYESKEAFSYFYEKWNKEGLSDEEISSRMMKFGAKKEWLEEYLSSFNK
jgi:hypoxanthine phosphoribosyltransferase